MSKPILLVKPATMWWAGLGGILSWALLLAIFFGAVSIFTWVVTPETISSQPTPETIFENVPVMMKWEATSSGPQLSEHFSFVDSRGRVFRCEWDIPGLE